MAPKVAYRSKTDLVAEAIKEMVQSGELEPGTELRQREIADILGVSPTPVREALRRLEAEGFVASEPHRAAVVVRPENSEVYQNALIRGTLEGLGAELAAKKVTSEDIEMLTELNARLGQAADLAEASRIDREFHLRIYEITGSPVLISQINFLWRTLGDGPPVDRPLDDWVGQHQKIIEALAAGDCSEANAATNSHIVDGFKGYAPAGTNSETG
jgi:DNA-binding GntR family transcriptional regulator